jgi:hypothetical protein
MFKSIKSPNFSQIWLFCLGFILILGTLTIACKNQKNDQSVNKYKLERSWETVQKRAKAVGIDSISFQKEEGLMYLPDEFFEQNLQRKKEALFLSRDEKKYDDLIGAINSLPAYFSLIESMPNLLKSYVNGMGGEKKYQDWKNLLIAQDAKIIHEKNGSIGFEPQNKTWQAELNKSRK